VHPLQDQPDDRARAQPHVDPFVASSRAAGRRERPTADADDRAEYPRERRELGQRLDTLKAQDRHRAAVYR
jgi:hypothetical protein